MGINIGGVDLAQSAMDSEFRIIVLEHLVELLINKSGGQNIASTQEIEAIRAKAFEQLKKKYPNAGLERK